MSKFKTTHAQLQSRISLRRNFITKMENEILRLKHVRSTLKDLFGNTYSTPVTNKEIGALRSQIRTVANDQKLDKRLMKLVLIEEGCIRDAASFGYVLASPI